MPAWKKANLKKIIKPFLTFSRPTKYCKLKFMFTSFRLLLVELLPKAQRSQSKSQSIAIMVELIYRSDWEATFIWETNSSSAREVLNIFNPWLDSHLRAIRIVDVVTNVPGALLPSVISVKISADLPEQNVLSYSSSRIETQICKT